MHFPKSLQSSIPKRFSFTEVHGANPKDEKARTLVPMPPLVVDLDGTLTKTDTLHESLIQIAKSEPFLLLGLALTSLKGRARFKDAVAKRVVFDAAHLPYRPELLEYLRAEKGKGRQIILATAAHKSIADKVAAHLNLFDHVLASNSYQNLKGVKKLEAIRKEIGGDFSYAGDSQSDLAVWKHARAAILSGASPKVVAAAKECTVIEREFPRERSSVSTWIRALRVHQWLKNLLIFLPLLTSFAFASDPLKIVPALIAFLAFSLAASGTYILNDLWDLESDRQHPRKRNRPFACATLPIYKGVIAAISAMAVAFALSTFVSSGLAMMLLGYVLLTTSYSWALKSYVLIDVVILSLLYTFRILAGSVATGIPVSSWLLAFSVFIFLSLAMVKRCSELVSLSGSGQNFAKGRDYRVSDLTIMWPMGVGSAISAIVVFGLFINSPETQSRYASPWMLWFIAVGLLYWTGRLWFKTSRGEMHDDPVVYAMKDKSSLTSLSLMIGTMIAAHSVNIPSIF